MVIYNKLWKLLIDKHMTKTQLKNQANISTNALAKLSKNKIVSLVVLIKICNVLNCQITDIMDIEYNGEVDE